MNSFMEWASAVDQDFDFIAANSADALTLAELRVLAFDSLTKSYNDAVDIKNRMQLSLMDIESDALVSTFEVESTLEQLSIDGIVQKCGSFYRKKFL